MKKYFQSLLYVVTLLTVNAVYAGQKVYDVTCQAWDGVCYIDVNGTSKEVPLSDLPKYMPVGDPSSAADKDDNFLLNGNGQIVGLNGENPIFKSGATGSGNAPAVTGVDVGDHFKVQIERTEGLHLTFNTVHVLNVGGPITISAMDINQDPECQKRAQYTKFLKPIRMGEEATFMTYCNPIQIDVMTDQGTASYKVN